MTFRLRPCLLFSIAIGAAWSIVFWGRSDYPLLHQTQTVWWQLEQEGLWKLQASVKLPTWSLTLHWCSYLGMPGFLWSFCKDRERLKMYDLWHYGALLEEYLQIYYDTRTIQSRKALCLCELENVSWLVKELSATAELALSVKICYFSSSAPNFQSSLPRQCMPVTSQV